MYMQLEDEFGDVVGKARRGQEMSVADLAAAHDLALSPHGGQEVHIHLVAGVPAGLILEYYRGTVDPLWDTKFKHTLKLDKDGMLAPPDRPGFGIEPNYAALEPYRVG